MSDARLLTMDEAQLLSRATEHWLRLGEVELNPGEQALALLSQATLRPRGCTREDVAGLNWTLQIEPADGREVREFTLVCPRDADVSQRRVSVLTPLGLSFIGQTVGAMARLPHATGGTSAVRILGVRRCDELGREAEDPELRHVP